MQSKRPKVIINKKISKISTKEKNHYIIKVINKNKRDIINIKVNLSLVKTSEIPGGIIPIYQVFFPEMTLEMVAKSGQETVRPGGAGVAGLGGLTRFALSMKYLSQVDPLELQTFY